MKTYAVRKQFRASVQGMVSYSADGTWITGKVWDLSQTGWRTTIQRPLPIGLETIVFLTLGEGEDIRHFLIESAIVRWSNGCHAGWEILRMDALSEGSLEEVMEQRESRDVPSQGMLIHA